jgi:DNA-binding transcriptional regulator GbsR (MarR family)
MKINEAKEKFIHAWGTLGSNWGIGRTMAQTHALLLISAEPLCTEDVMTELQISSGNANMNLNALIDLNLVSKVLKAGERKVYFSAEKDTWKIALEIIKERKKRELEPVINLLAELNKLDADKRNKEVKAFADTINSLQSVVTKADKTIELLMKLDEKWFMNPIIKMIK